MKWFNNLKMIQKLLSSFIIIALFMGFVGFIGMYNMTNIDKNLESIYKIDMVGMNAISNIKSNLLEIRGDLLLILDPINKNDIKKNEENIDRLVALDNALIVEYKTTITTELDRKQFGEFEKLLGD